MKSKSISFKNKKSLTIASCSKKTPIVMFADKLMSIPKKKVTKKYSLL